MEITQTHEDTVVLCDYVHSKVSRKFCHELELMTTARWQSTMLSTVCHTHPDQNIHPDMQPSTESVAATLLNKMTELKESTDFEILATTIVKEKLNMTGSKF